MVVKIQVVFWVVTMCGDGVGYKHFGRACYLHLRVEYGGGMKVGREIEGMCRLDKTMIKPLTIRATRIFPHTLVHLHELKQTKCFSMRNAYTVFGRKA
jgi:hypothetical protein